MKIKGKVIEGPNIELIVIPRGSSDDIIFKAQAVLDFDDFDNITEQPKPPQRMFAGDKTYSPVLDDPEFLTDIKAYNKLRMSWLILKSLEATEGLEWETVDMNDSTTWNNYDPELTAAGITNVEIGRIVKGCMIANSLDQSKIDEARKHFLATEREEAGLSVSPQDVAQTTQSGELAKDSESVQKESS